MVHCNLIQRVSSTWLHARGRASRTPSSVGVSALKKCGNYASSKSPQKRIYIYISILTTNRLGVNHEYPYDSLPIYQEMRLHKEENNHTAFIILRAMRIFLITNFFHKFIIRRILMHVAGRKQHTGYTHRHLHNKVIEI